MKSWGMHSSESYGGLLSWGNVYYVVQGGSNFCVCGWNSVVSPLKWKLLSSTFLCYCWHIVISFLISHQIFLLQKNVFILDKRSRWKLEKNSSYIFFRQTEGIAFFYFRLLATHSPIMYINFETFKEVISKLSRMYTHARPVNLTRLSFLSAFWFRSQSLYCFFNLYNPSATLENRIYVLIN